ncbi:UDP-glycosyltransferase UGT5-like [Bradysia coprophila]|uniref:UDP-glycosyltransferase UGT5-like n=1 Tax=Bradysia coprophila TaxID=38358 RepID=UPI00187D734C|nr:UDP-glycosyltransferase UGT5-like [Bradysia coprophila]
MKSLHLLVVFGLAILKTDGLKVLTIAPFSSKSHFAIANAISKTLHKAGHNITMLSPFPLKKPLQNHTDISVAKTMAALEEEDDMNIFDFRSVPMVAMLPFMYYMMHTLVDSVMVDDEVTKFMESKEKYDVCIVEVFNMDAIMGIADHVDCVIISFATFGAVKWVDDMTSNQSPNSYVTNPFLRYTDRMAFSERLVNTVSNIFESIAFEFFHKPLQRSLYKKHFPNAKRSFDEIYKSSAIYFMNTHVSSAFARPYLPHMIDIGGIHVEPAQPLPEDIKAFLDASDEGAIVFSMGSNIQATDWPVEMREIFVKTFGKLKQKVLWKYENDTLAGKTDNVMISKWLPQRDVIAHPNVKLFITHGGLLGTTEALIEGLPVLGIPIFGDQKMNMAKAVTRGYGLQLYYDEITIDSLFNSIQELISNQKYRHNAQEISKRFVDRPMTPQETVTYWVEYAVRHNGALHLRAAGNDLNFIAFHSIDTYGVLFVAAVIYLYGVYLVLGCLFGKCCGKKNAKKSKKLKEK